MRPLTLICVVVVSSAALAGAGNAPRALALDAPESAPASRGADVLDVEISSVSNLTQWGRNGDYPGGRVGLGVLTESHNVGTVNVDWYSAGNPGDPIDNRHPFIAQSVFRIRSGRLEQIGISWLKHGFFSVNDDCPDPGGNFLGVGCYDTYGSSTNATRAWLGPRSEVNPLTGHWEPCGSHFDTGEIGYPASDPGDCIRSHYDAGHNAVQHRLRVYDADILAANDLRDMYFEAFYVVAGDENIWNNWAHRKCLAVYNSTTTKWEFTSNSPVIQSPIVTTWGDMNDIASPDSEGTVIVASRVVSLGGGMHRYEYCVYNMNLDRQIESFSVPLPTAGLPVTVSDVNFLAPRENEEFIYSEAPWTATIASDSVTWAPSPPNTMAGEEYPNTLRYGVMHTCWFTADRAPADASATLTQFKPGVEGALSATVRAPECLLGPEDINGDGVVNTADLGLLVGAFGTSGPLGDINGDNTVNTADLGLLVAAFGTACH